MKILLIHPKLEGNFFKDIQLPPLGLAYIAGVLRKAEYEVKIFDAILSRNQLQEIKELELLEAKLYFKPDVPIDSL